MADQDNLPSGNRSSRPQVAPLDTMAGADEKLAVSPNSAYSPRFVLITILGVVIIAGLVLLLLPEKKTTANIDQSANSTAEVLRNSIQSLLPEPSLGASNPPPATLENSRPSGLVKIANLNTSNDQNDTRSLQNDSDQDGLLDRLEERYKTDPNKADTDDDGLVDILEIYVYETDPLVADTDGDGFSDQEEVTSGHNPNGPG